MAPEPLPVSIGPVGIPLARGVEVAGSEIDDGQVAAPVATRDAPLQLEQIETIPLRVELARTYRGSAYKMTHRSTLIVRLHTSAGAVSAKYRRIFLRKLSQARPTRR